VQGHEHFLISISKIVRVFILCETLMAPDSYDFLLIFSVATVGMLILAGAIILFIVFYQKKMIKEQMKRQALEFEYQQKMMQAEMESQESERRRLAADLHDSIGGMLSTIRVGLSTLARTLPDPRSMDETKAMLDDTISSVRRISRDLMPSTLERFGFLNAVKELCERFQGTSKISIHFSEPEEIPAMDKPRQLMLFRIIQELLNNAIKHASANAIYVTIQNANGIYVSVEDDGVGFDPIVEMKENQNGKGLGLFNIENRARLLGGKLEYPKPLKGSKTVLTIPVKHA
jgi:two-component system, NarL family, sensor kinase